MRHDVLIVGGGPAGSTSANLLAHAGRDVLVLEREHFPRFHIGESLLPCDQPIFERLGVDLSGAFVRKGGAEFHDERTGQHEVFPFADGMNGSPSIAWQVERSKFDHFLLEKAESRGAKVRFGSKVVRTEIGADGVAVTVERVRADGTPEPGAATEIHQARFLVDATGQDALLARQSKTIEPWEGFGRAAVFCHFEGLSGPAVDALYATGNIKVLLVEEGWMWLIPLAGPKLSVGLVTRRQGVKPEWLDDAIAASPVTLSLTKGATRTPARIIRNFSFKNSRTFGARHACIGDAAAFLDPVFSSGVSLAMLSGEYLADRLAPALAENREGDPQLMAALAAHMDVAYKSFGGLVHSFYHLRLVHSLFFGENKEDEIRRGVISVLAGDVWRADNRFRNMLLDSSRRASPFTA